MSESLWSHGLQHARLLCPWLSPRVCSNSCPLSRWCYLTTSSSVIPFSSCLQSFLASGSFPMSQLFASGGQSIEASASVLPMNVQDGFPLRLSGLISLLSKGLSRVFSSTTTWQPMVLVPNEICFYCFDCCPALVFLWPRLCSHPLPKVLLCVPKKHRVCNAPSVVPLFQMCVEYLLAISSLESGLNSSLFLYLLHSSFSPLSDSCHLSPALCLYKAGPPTPSHTHTLYSVA